MGDDSGPDYASMHAKTRESLSDRMIFAKTGLAFKARAAGSTRKLADRQRKTVDDGRSGVIGQEAIADQAPDAFLDRPQIGRLSQEGGAIHQRNLFWSWSALLLNNRGNNNL